MSGDVSTLTAEEKIRLNEEFIKSGLTAGLHHAFDAETNSVIMLPNSASAPVVAMSLKRYLVYDSRRAEILQIGNVALKKR